MRFNDAARVGLTVVVGLAILIWATFWLRSRVATGDTYIARASFADAQGLQEGAYVRVRGVTLGEVASVGLGADSRALVEMRIAERYPLKDTDSIRIVTSIGGFTPPYVEITPNGKLQPEAKTLPPGLTGEPVPPGTVVVGQEGTNTDRLIEKAEKLVDDVTLLSGEMKTLTRNFNQLAGDPKLKRNLLRTAENFAVLSERGVLIAGNMQQATASANRLFNQFQGTANDLSRTLRKADQLLASFRGASDETGALLRDARELVADTRGVVKSSEGVMENTSELLKNANGLVGETRAFINLNRPQLQQIVNSLNSSLKNLDATLAETRTFFADPELRQDFQATARSIREASENLKLITEDVRGLTGDPKVQEDLRASIAGLREVTEEAAGIFDRVRTVLGAGGKTAKSIGERVSEAELDVALRRAVRSDQTRLDLNATIPWNDDTFYRLGFYDFGETNRFNVQMGQRLRSNLWARYGIYASKLGFGLDFGSRTRPLVSLDAFGVDNPQVDLYGNLPLGRNLDIIAGFDNITRRADPIFGVRYRR
ncbi:MAG: MlaD family protein [Armatimonadota bacterium]